jgi:hypothetical protein
MRKNIFTQTTKKFSYFLITIILVLGLSISAQSLLAAWTTPTASPPSNNVSPPLTEGVNDQVKAGSLGIAGDLYVFDNVILATSSGAKVGIGTAFPAHKLHVYEKDPAFNGNAEIDIQSGGEPNDNSHWAIYNNRDALDNSLRFWHGNNYLTILSNGNVGIGADNPSQKLDVNGKIRMQTQTANSDADDIVATKGYVDTKTSHTQSGCQAFDAGQAGWQRCPDGYYMVGLYSDNDDDYADSKGVWCCPF